ncbi:MAG: hypothetical protein HUU18_12995, partial [Phycisphaerales bacterium]|nr:hypothetical protein [Phycisphaerales bacterium]
MPTDLLAALTQFGTAGLIGWMWLSERRAGTQRERQLDEAHERLMSERKMFEQVIGAAAENARVLAQLEASVRSLGRA